LPPASGDVGVDASHGVEPVAEPVGDVVHRFTCLEEQGRVSVAAVVEPDRLHLAGGDQGVEAPGCHVRVVGRAVRVAEDQAVVGVVVAAEPDDGEAQTGLALLETRVLKGRFREMDDASAHTVSAQIHRSEDSMTTPFYELIKEGATETRRPEESMAQAIRRYEGEHPEIYKAFRASLEKSEPVQKSFIQSAAERQIEERLWKEMSIDPSLTREEALVRAIEGREGREIMREYNQGRSQTIKAMDTIHIDADRAKAEAHRRLQDAISRTMAEKHIDKAQATVLVVKSEEGQRDYQVVLGLAEPDKPRAPISKADTSFERIRAIAKTMLSAGKVKTIEEGVAKVAKENPELYREYRSAMDAEAAEAAQRPT
jgi:hypothetical protein